MRHIKDIVFESLLDDEDDIMDRGYQSTMDRLMPEKFAEWVQMDFSGWPQSSKRMAKSNTASKSIKVKDGRLSIENFSAFGPFSLKSNIIPIPEDIKLGHISSMVVTGESEVLDLARKNDQLPTSVTNFTICGSVKHGLDNFDIECCDCTIDPGPVIKNMTLRVPSSRPGLTLNTFEHQYRHITSENDLKNIKIDGVHNITVILADSEYGPQVAVQAKKEVMKLRKKYPNTKIKHLFLQVLQDIFPLDWIEKNWKGVDTLILKVNQTNGMWPKGVPATIVRYLRTGDLVLKKTNGKWEVFQKMVKTEEDEYYKYR